MAEDIQTYIRERSAVVEEQYVALRNESCRDGLRSKRPVESKHANIGISPGTGEDPRARFMLMGEVCDASRTGDRAGLYQDT